MKKGRRWIIPCVLVLLNVIFWTTILKIELIPSASMAPTIPAVSFRIFNLTAYWGAAAPDRNDVVLLWSSEKDKYLVKRVIGMPGDTVQIYNDYLVINGTEVYEDFAYGDNLTDTAAIDASIVFVVPAGKYFLLGDNRDNSIDSRFWKEPYIPESDIKGVLL